MMPPLTVRQIKRLADQWIGPRPWAPEPPCGQRPEATVAANLRNIGFGWDAVRSAMIEGDIGDDGWFEVVWNGVTIRFPVRPADS